MSNRRAIQILCCVGAFSDHAARYCTHPPNTLTLPSIHGTWGDRRDTLTQVEVLENALSAAHQMALTFSSSGALYLRFQIATMDGICQARSSVRPVDRRSAGVGDLLSSARRRLPGGSPVRVAARRPASVLS